MPSRSKVITELEIGTHCRMAAAVLFARRKAESTRGVKAFCFINIEQTTSKNGRRKNAVAASTAAAADAASLLILYR
jgi:hypothetical protein